MHAGVVQLLGEGVLWQTAADAHILVTLDVCDAEIPGRWPCAWRGN